VTGRGSSDRTREEAAAWFARLSRVSVSSETLRAFQAWRRESANARAYEEVERAWQAAGGLAVDPQIQSATRLAMQRGPALRGHRGIDPRLAGFGAAGALAAAAAWFALSAEPVYRTQVGEQRLVVLEDGSRVRLNTDTVVQVRYRRAARSLELRRGQAFFDVAADPDRPFVVTANAVRVTALGTSFDVRRTDETVQVTLLEGAVAVAHGDREAAQLTPNQQLTATPEGLSQPRPTDAAEAAGWTTGRLTFRNVPLRAAIAEMNRYSEDKLVLEAPEQLAQAPVSGVFDVGDAAAFEAAVEAIFPLQSRPEPGGVRLVPRPSPGS
jgi:transmembrane sensor